MSQGITLAKGPSSKDFAERLTDYYRFTDPGGRGHKSEFVPTETVREIIRFREVYGS